MASGRIASLVRAAVFAGAASMDWLQGVGGLSQHRPQPKSFPAWGLVGQWPGPEVPRVHRETPGLGEGRAERSSPWGVVRGARRGVVTALTQ